MTITLHGLNTLIPLIKEFGFSQVRAVKAYKSDEASGLHDELIVYECLK